MRRYETFVIFDPDLSEDQRAPVVDRIKDTITKQDGFLVEVDDWGSRKLAYEIKKKFRGYYSRLDYCGGGPLVNELERFFRIDDRVLKYMTVQLEESADLEQIKEEIAQAEAEKAEKARSRSEAAAKAAEAKAAASEAPAPEPPATEEAAAEEPASDEPAPETSTEPAAEAEETETEEPATETKPAEAGKEE